MLRSDKHHIIETSVVDSPDLLPFRSLTVDALPLIDSYLRRAHTRSCDYTIGGLYLWTDLFDYKYCIVDDTLFIKGLNEDYSGGEAFAVPIGSLPLQKAVEMVRRHCRLCGIEPVFSAVPEDMLDDLSACGMRRVTELPDIADYIYDAEALASLRGKAYNKKRNHVNRFIADNPDYSLEILDARNIGQTLTFLRTLGIESEKADPSAAQYEWRQTEYLLEHYADFPFIGAVLNDGRGNIVAFTIGEMLQDTLVLHIEKMEHLVAGAGEAINMLFAKHMTELHPELRLINREDDTGDPGLRYAKESYHPLYKLRKYNVAFEPLNN